ncbi:2-hydroxyacyl-CoA dehydratase family protein [Pelagibacterium limicola]|uniref:2-hydroxyacyl-CoA dehydratase family protein n=1 Tax=Pelagibacterium limicola TaxID=2791022 RepID=UPI0018AFECD8|nr:2-hydroxyacyl-CoA dehydratase family protein [Pelagibacterium limicola]
MPVIVTPDASGAAVALSDAFDQRDLYAGRHGAPCVGVFGNCAPEVLIEAAGAIPVQLAMGSRQNAGGQRSPIDEVIEPFVDAEVRRFLRRLFDGAFSPYRAIIFPRDDASALIAYQYATEWVRQGQADKGVPPLFLWNLVHTDSVPVRDFNRRQADRLFGFLKEIGLTPPDSLALAHAGQQQARQSRLLGALQETVGNTMSGGTAMRWRNAGRFMSASEHADLLERAQGVKVRSPASGCRIGLVGSALASTATYEMLESIGPVVCDLQPWGQMWPLDLAGAEEIDAILAALAADPFCPRITPASLHRTALVEALTTARCDIVVCQLAQTDDTFGWEIPSLAAQLERCGTRFINLGFRDPEPDEQWLAESLKAIAASLEGF